MVTRFRALVPLGPPSPSLPALIGLGEVGILLIYHQLSVFAIIFAQQGVGIRDNNA